MKREDLRIMQIRSQNPYANPMPWPVTDDELRSMRDELLPILLLEPCATCNGSGDGGHYGVGCEECGGRGTVPVEGVTWARDTGFGKKLVVPLSMLEGDGQ